MTNKELKKIFSPIAEDVKNVWSRDIFSNVFKTPVGNQTPEEYINHSLYFEAKTFLHGLLVVEDKLSMAYSLETRVPFLDNDLVDFAQKVPVRFKLGELQKAIKMNENDLAKTQKTNDGKIILRKAMSKYIPEDIHTAVKKGFSSPDQSWFKGESIEFVKAIIFNDNAKIYNYLNKEEIQKLIREHLSGEQNKRLFLWSLLNFEEWCGMNE